MSIKVGINGFGRIGRMVLRCSLQHPEIEIVDVCTGGDENGGWHYEPTMEALAAGKHVLVEKPMASSAQECRLMIDACREAGVEWYVVEMDNCPKPPLESIELALRNLRRMGIVS